MRASSARASSSSPTPTPSAAASAVAAAVSSAIIAAAKVLARALASATGRIVLSGIVVRREILRGRGVRIRLAFLGVTRVRFIMHFCGVRVMNLAVCGVVFYDAGLFVVRQGIVVRRLVMRGFVVK